MSAGVRGAHYTIGPRGRRATVGLPGTGLSYTTYSSHHARHAAEQHSRVASHQPSALSVPSVRSSPQPMSPAVKLGWGVILGIFGLLLVVPFLPVGLLLLGGGVWLSIVGFNQRKQPKWQIRALIRKATKLGANRDELLGQALKIDRENPEALAACAENAFRNADWSSANQLFERYLAKAPTDSQAQLHLGFSYMNAGDTDKALQRLEPIRAAFGPDSPAGLTNAVAIGFLKKGEPGQALEILKILPLRKQILDTALQQSLFLRALAHYQSHQKAAALGDFDRLYALKPDYPSLEAVREAIKAGTFDLNSIQFSVGR